MSVAPLVTAALTFSACTWFRSLEAATQAQRDALMESIKPDGPSVWQRVMDICIAVVVALIVIKVTERKSK